MSFSPVLAFLFVFLILIHLQEPVHSIETTETTSEMNGRSTVVFCHHWCLIFRNSTEYRNVFVHSGIISKRSRRSKLSFSLFCPILIIITATLCSWNLRLALVSWSCLCASGAVKINDILAKHGASLMPNMKEHPFVCITVTMINRCITFDCLLSRRISTIGDSVFFTIGDYLRRSTNTADLVLRTHWKYVLRSHVSHVIFHLHLQYLWHRLFLPILTGRCRLLNCWPSAMVVSTRIVAKWEKAFNGNHAFEQAIVRIHRILVFCLYILVDIDCVNVTPNFDADRGGFISAIVTNYQSDFEWKCFSCNDTYEDEDDLCGDNGGEGNDESEEWGQDSYNKPYRQSTMRCPSVTCFISLFATCRSDPFAHYGYQEVWQFRCVQVALGSIHCRHSVLRWRFGMLLRAISYMGTDVHWCNSIMQLYPDRFCTISYNREIV